jgi:hypothetical protein
MFEFSLLTIIIIGFLAIGNILLHINRCLTNLCQTLDKMYDHQRGLE